MSSAAALVTAITGAVVGITGVIYAWSNSRSERTERERLEGLARAHERQLAQDVRSFESKGKVYEDLLFTLGLVAIRLEAGVQSIERLWALDRGGISVRTIGLDETLPQAPGNEELLRLAARVGTFGSETISPLVEQFVRLAADLGQAVDSFTSTAAPEGQDEETRELLREYIEGRRGFVLAADALQEVEGKLRTLLPDEDSHLLAWEKQHHAALNELTEFTDTLLRLDSLPIPEDPYWRVQVLGEEVPRLESIANVLTNATHEGFAIIQSESQDEVALLQLELVDPDYRQHRLERKLEPLLPYDVHLLRRKRDDLQTLGRDIQEHAQRELRLVEA